MNELIQKYFLSALLADAAYARNLNQAVFVDGKPLDQALVDDGRFGGGVAPNHNKETALIIARNFELIDQSVESTQLFDSGFSGTLYKSTDENSLTSEFVISLRGTESGGISDVSQDIFSTDIGDIGIEGFAAKQAVDLFNWFSVISSPAGAPALQLKYLDSVSPLRLLLEDAVSSTYGGLVGGKPTVDAIVYDDDAVGTAQLPAGATIDITGHSLGGHLTMILARIASQRLNEAYAFNGPGFDSSIGGQILSESAKYLLYGGDQTEWFFEGLKKAQLDSGNVVTVGNSFPSDKIVNLDAPFDEIHNIGFKYTRSGEVDPDTFEVYSEGKPPYDPGLTDNGLGVFQAHLMGDLSETLEVYNTLGFLFKDTVVNLGIGIDNSTLRSDLNASIENSGTGQDLDSFLDSLIVLFDVTVPAKTSDDKRTDIQRKTAAIAEKTLIQTISELDGYVEYRTVSAEYFGLEIHPFELESNDSLAANLSTSIAHRYSLINSLPFVVTGNESIYDIHNVNNELDLELFTIENPDGVTQALIDDLQNKSLLQRNLFSVDNITGYSPGLGEGRVEITDSDGSRYTNTESLRDSVYVGDTGDNEHESRTSTSFTGYRLFGLSGNDKLIGSTVTQGLNGKEHLEGGAGDDTLIGNRDVDLLFGGAGNDRLYGAGPVIGDSSADFLYGGSGEDVYFVGDLDQVFDLPADNAIILLQSNGGENSKQLGGGVREKDDPENTWFERNSNDEVLVEYKLVGDKLFATSYGGEFGGQTITFNNVQFQPAGEGLSTYLGMRFSEEPDLEEALPVNGEVPDGVIEVDWSKKEELRQEARDLDLSERERAEQQGLYQDYFEPLTTGWVSGSVVTRDKVDEKIVITDMPAGTAIPFGEIDAGPGNSIVVDLTKRTAPADGEEQSEGEDPEPEEFGLRILDNWQTPEFDTLGSRVLNQQEWESLGGVNPDPGLGDTDILVGGERRSWLMSTYGNDILIGGESGDILQSGFKTYPHPEVRGTGLIRDWVYQSELNQSKDQLFGNGGNDYLMADADQNELYGGPGQDVLFAGADDDRLVGGDDNDYLSGDIYFQEFSKVELGSISFAEAPKNDGELYGADTLEGGKGDDSLGGGAGNDFLFGQDDNDTLFGDDPGQFNEEFLELHADKHGDDQLFGGSGNDSIMGHGGSDTALGGADTDQIYGDRLAGRDEPLDVEFHGEDKLYGGGATDYIYGDGNNDELYGGAGDDYLIGDDTFDSDRLAVEDHGDDILYGDGGQDTLMGSGGSDTLEGGAGRDTLYGFERDATEIPDNNDNDILIGGPSDDYMYGQGGNDTYRYNRGDGYDVITDESGSQDKVQFSFSSDSVSWFRLGSDLYMNAGADELAVRDYFSGNSVDTFEFSDGVALNRAEIIQQTTNQFGTSAGEVFLSSIFGGFINGNGGFDSVQFRGSRSQYDVTVVSGVSFLRDSGTVAKVRRTTQGITDASPIPDGATVTVTDRVTGAVTTLIGVEELLFADESTNISPAAVDDSFSTDEDQVLVIAPEALLANDSDEDNGLLRVDTVEAVSGGTAAIDTDGNIVFTPNTEFSGQAELRYTLIDRQGGQSQASVTIDVGEINDLPVFEGNLDDLSIKATTELSYPIPADRFSDIDSESLNYGILQADGSELPEWLSFNPETLILNGTPPEESVGVIELTVIAVDDQLGFSTVPLNVEVTTSVLPPELIGDSTTGTEDVVTDISFDALTDNDTDPDGEPLIIDSVSNATNGIAELTPTGVRFTPDQDFAGEASFEYHVTKTNGLSGSAVVKLQIDAVNDAPVVGFVQPDQIIDAGRQFLFAMPDDLFVDADGDDLSYSATLADGSALPTWIEYVSAGSKDPGYFVGRLDDRSGTDITVRVTATDGSESEFQDFQISAPAVDNLPPLPLQDFLTYATENATIFEIPLESLLFAVIDPDDDAMSVVSITPVDGTAQIVGESVQVTADAGIASFDYVVEDEAGNTTDLGAEVLFEETNQPPQYFGFNPESDFRTRAGQLFEEEFSTLDFFDDSTVALKLSATLENGDPLPAWLQVIFDQESGSLRLTGRPAESDVGEISVAVNAIDNQLASTPVVYQLAVYPEVNVDPVAVADSLTTYEDEILEVSSAELLGNDSDPEKAELSIVDVGNAVGGTVELVDLGEQKVVFTPEEDYNSERNGAAGFEYTLSDGEGGSTIGQADIDIRPVVDFEVKTGAFIEPQQAVAGEEFLLNIPDNSLYHPDGDPVQLTVTMADGSAAPEWVEIDSDSRVLRVVPPADAVGDLEFTLSGDTTLGYFGFPARSPLLLEIQANDSVLPTAADDSFNLQEDQVLNIEHSVLLANDTGNGSDPLTVVSVGNAVNGRVTDRQGRISFTPSENYSGPARFSYTAQAADGTMSVAAVELQIESVDDPLTVVEQNVAFTVNAGAFSVTMPELFTDADSDQLAYEVTMADGSELPGWLKYIPGESEKDAGELFGNVLSTEDISLDLTVTATTHTGDSASWPVSLSVTGSQINLAPIAGGDVISALSGAPAELAIETLLANDIDPERQALTFNRVVEVTDGTVELLDGNLSVLDGGNGVARFSYSVTDDKGAESIQWVDVNFRSDDRSPLATAQLPTQRLYPWRDTSYWTLPATTFRHPDNDTLRVEATLEDGSPLPDWLTFIDQHSADAAQDAQGNILPKDYFAAETRWIFSAILPKNMDGVPPAMNLKITATDPDGDTVSAVQIVTLFGNYGFDANQQAEDRFYTRVNEPIIIKDDDLFKNDGYVYAYQGFVTNEEHGRARAVTNELRESFEYVEFTPETDFTGTASFNLDLAGRESTVYVEIEGPNRPPAVSVEDATIQAGEESVIALPTGAISDPDNDELDVDFMQQDGSALPGWIVFDSESNSFIANPPIGGDGTLNIVATVIDPDGLSASDTFAVNVLPVLNLAPTAVEDEIDASVGVMKVFAASELLINDFDPEGGVLEVIGVTQGDGGSVKLENGEIEYLSDDPYRLADSFTYTVQDEEGATSEAGVFVDITDASEWLDQIEHSPDDKFTNEISYEPSDEYEEGSEYFLELEGSVNEPPVANHDEVAGTEDQASIIPVSKLLENDTDTEAAELTVVSVENPVDGTVVLDGDEVVFTPDENFNGDASFEYTINDDEGAASSASVTVVVEPVNDSPVAADDAFSGVEDEALSVTVADLLTNDTDIDDSELTVVSVADSVNGTVELHGDEVIFTPEANFYSEATFSYTIEDASGASSTATARIDVAPVNDAPLAVDDAFDGVEDEALNISVADLLVNDTDIDDSELTVVSVVDPVNGTVELLGDEVIFTPETNFNGEATFGYTIEDAAGASSTATVRVDVAAVNDAPVAVDDAFNGDEDEALSISVADLLVNDTDIDDSELTVVSVADPVNGTVELQGDEVVFTPDANFNGEATFSYTIEDAAGTSSTATARIDVTPVNDAPIANNDAFLAVEDEVRRIPVSLLLANDTDIDGDVLSVVSVGDAENGVVELVDAEVLFTPTANYNGPALFSYTVADAFGAQDIATVSITVLPANDKPLARDDSFDGIEDEVKRITVAQLLANDTDIDGDELKVVSVGGAENGLVELVGDEVFFTPDENYSGAANFSYTVEDTAQAQSTATVNLDLAPVNDGPIAVDDQFTGVEDEPLQILTTELLANDADIDGDDLVVNSVGEPQNGTVVLDGDTVIFTPDANYSGSAVFTYTIADTAGAQSSASVNLTIDPDEEEPIFIEPLDDIALEDCKPFHYQVPVVVRDAEQADLKYRLLSSDGSALPGWLTFDSNTLIISGTPPIGESISLDFTLTVMDGADTAQTALTINVGGAEINGITKSGNWYSNRIYGSRKNDSLSGGYGNDLLLGRSGDDLLSGDSGHDVLKGGSGDDRILGGDGCDTIYGQHGNDKVYAGAHNDRYYDWYGDNCADGGSGHDVLKTGHGRDHLRGGTGNDLIYGGGGDDSLFGDDGSDRLFGQYGDDYLSGGAGHDLLKDYDGHNEMYGGADRDYLFSGNGNDKVSGGTGDDVLNAGRGDDTYLYSLGDGRDLICDHGGNDTLRLSGLSSEDVTYKRKYNDLYVLATDDGYVRVQNWFKRHGRIESVEFDNGDVINTEDIYRLVDSITRFDGQASSSDGITGMLSDDDDQGVLLAA